jgi:hypothetical protein
MGSDLEHIVLIIRGLGRGSVEVNVMSREWPMACQVAATVNKGKQVLSFLILIL